jgi:hypothetical protein
VARPSAEAAHTVRNGNELVMLCSRRMKLKTEQNIFDLVGLVLMAAGFIGVVIDVVWGLWTQDANAILFGLAAIGLFLVGMKILNYSFTKYPK